MSFATDRRWRHQAAVHVAQRRFPGGPVWDSLSPRTGMPKILITLALGEVERCPKFALLEVRSWRPPTFKNSSWRVDLDEQDDIFLDKRFLHLLLLDREVGMNDFCVWSSRWSRCDFLSSQPSILDRIFGGCPTRATCLDHLEAHGDGDGVW